MNQGKPKSIPLSKFKKTWRLGSSGVREPTWHCPQELLPGKKPFEDLKGGGDVTAERPPHSLSSACRPRLIFRIEFRWRVQRHSTTVSEGQSKPWEHEERMQSTNGTEEMRGEMVTPASRLPILPLTLAAALMQGQHSDRQPRGVLSSRQWEWSPEKYSLSLPQKKKILGRLATLHDWQWDPAVASGRSSHGETLNDHKSCMRSVLSSFCSPPHCSWLVGVSISWFPTLPMRDCPHRYTQGQPQFFLKKVVEFWQNSGIFCW